MAKKAIVTGKTDRAKRQAAASEVIDVGVSNLLPAVSDDEKFVQQAGQGVLAFLKSLAGFFLTASTMEANAKTALQVAASLTPPKTPDEDERIQRFVKDTNDQKKVVEEHWKVTAVISGFHRRMTAARARATDPLERAAMIGNQLHQRFKEDAERTARIEQDRIRREADEQALKDRQAELDRLEADAVAAEEKSPKLSEREQAFVDFYCDKGSMAYDNAQRAATMAGFKGKNLVAISGRLLSLEKIRVAIEAKTKAREIRLQAAAQAAAPATSNVPTIAPAVQRASGTSERTYYSAELLDEKALIDAICEGRLGIPRDVLRVHQPALNGYAVSLRDLISRWPGVKLKTTTKVV
jgi:hypothetical protein